MNGRGDGLDTGRPLVGRHHERDGTVVFDADAHVSSKAAGLGRYSTLAKLLHEHLVEVFGALRIARLEQARPPAATHVRKQCELGNDQGGSVHVYEAHVHPTRLVPEDAQAQDLANANADPSASYLSS